MNVEALEALIREQTALLKAHTAAIEALVATLSRNSDRKRATVRAFMEHYLSLSGEEGGYVEGTVVSMPKLFGMVNAWAAAADAALHYEQLDGVAMLGRMLNEIGLPRQRHGVCCRVRHGITFDVERARAVLLRSG